MEHRDQIPVGQALPVAALPTGGTGARANSVPAPATIPLWRALGEILAVYVPSFGLGILSALMLLHNPSLGNDQVTGPVSALEEILQYVMQASVTVFGVAFFCLQRGVTLRTLFGRLKEPSPYPQAPYPYPYPQPPSLVTPAWGASQPAQYGQPQYGQPQYAQQDPRQQFPPAQHPPGFWPGYGYYMPPRQPTERGRSWQFSRSYFISMAGVLGFLISVVVYTAVAHYHTGAPSEGDSPYLVPVGLVVALAAGFGEEMLVTGLTVNSLEAAGVGGKRVWLIYLVAICLRIPFHLYYGWASLGVIIFTVVNIWVYRRWRLLWPIVLAHATYDFVEYLGSVAPAALAGLLLLGLGLATLVMVIVIICIEASDASSRRRYRQYAAAAGAAQAEHSAQAAQNGYVAAQPTVLPPQLPQMPPVPPMPQSPQAPPWSDDGDPPTAGPASEPAA